MRAELFLVDTSAWIASFQRVGYERLKAHLKASLERNIVAINGIVRFELLQGAKTPRAFLSLKERLSALHSLNTPEDVWERAAKLAFDSRKEGMSVPATDALIAQSALDHGCTLLHLDKHFDWIAERTALRALRFD